jgi:hypothetical protein
MLFYEKAYLLMGRLIKLIFVMVVWSALLLTLYFLFLKQPLDNYRTAQAWPPVGAYRVSQPGQINQVTFLAKLVPSQPLDLITPEAGVLRQWLAKPDESIEANAALITLNQSAEKWQKQLATTPWQLGQLDALDGPKPEDTTTTTEKALDKATTKASQAIQETDEHDPLAKPDEPVNIMLVKQKDQLVCPLAGVLNETMATIGDNMKPQQVVGRLTPFGTKKATGIITNPLDCSRLKPDQVANVQLSRGLYPLNMIATLTTLTMSKDNSSCKADLMFEDILNIADDSSGDTITDDEGNERINTEFVQRSKIRVDTRKWALSRMNPKKEKKCCQLVLREKHGDRCRC